MKRSRTGCQNCRIRKVKCDETLPQCSNCVTTGRQCEVRGQKFKSVQFKQPGETRAGEWKTSIAPGINSRRRSMYELQQFDYYITHAAGALGFGYDLDLWAVLLPSYAQTSQSTWYLLLAISSLAEEPYDANRLPCYREIDASKPKGEKQTKAVEWYGRALREAAKSTKYPIAGDITRDADGATLHCLMCIIVELQLGNALNALKLADIAFDLITRIEQSQVKGDIPSLVIPVLLRFATALSLYGFRLPSGIRGIAATCKKRLHHDTSNAYLLFLRDELCDLMYDAQCLTQANSDEPHTDKERRRIITSLEKWFHQLNHKCDKQETESGRAMYARLRSLYLVTKIQLHCYTDETSMRYDQFEADFAEIATTAEAIASPQPSSHGAARFSFELGSVACLIFAAWQCRISHIRQRLMSLLSRIDAQESFWTARGVRDLVSAVMALEGAHTQSPPYVNRRIRASFEVGRNDEKMGSVAVPDKYAIVFRYRVRKS